MLQKLFRDVVACDSCARSSCVTPDTAYDTENPLVSLTPTPSFEAAEFITDDEHDDAYSIVSFPSRRSSYNDNLFALDLDASQNIVIPDESSTHFDPFIPPSVVQVSKTPNHLLSLESALLDTIRLDDLKDVNYFCMGTHSKIFLANLDGQSVVLKQLSPFSLRNEVALKDFYNEIDVLSRLKHDNIVSILGYGDCNQFYDTNISHMIDRTNTPVVGHSSGGGGGFHGYDSCSNMSNFYHNHLNPPSKSNSYATLHDAYLYQNQSQAISTTNLSSLPPSYTFSSPSLFNSHSQQSSSQLSSSQQQYQQYSQPFIVLENLNGNSLSYHLNMKKSYYNRPFSILKYIQIAKELADVLYYLHECIDPTLILIHRDLKPDNIAFTMEGKLKLLDFGMSACVKKDESLQGTYELTGCSGSYRYMAPENALNQTYNEKVDIYSYGVILYEVITGCIPYNGYDRETLYNYVYENHNRPNLYIDENQLPIEISDSLRHVISMCWHPDQTQRPTAKWLSEYFNTIYIQMTDSSTTTTTTTTTSCSSETHDACKESMMMAVTSQNM